MRKMLLRGFIAAGILLLYGCKSAEAPEHTEETSETIDFEAEYEAVAEDADHIEMNLYPHVRVDADATAYEKYRDGLGIYDYTLRYQELGYGSYADAENAEGLVKDAAEVEKKFREYLGETAGNLKVKYNAWNEFNVEKQAVDSKYNQIDSYWKYYPESRLTEEEEGKMTEKIKALQNCFSQEGLFTENNTVLGIHYGEALYGYAEELKEKAVVSSGSGPRTAYGGEEFYLTGIYEEIEPGIPAVFYRTTLEDIDNNTDTSVFPDNVMMDGITVTPGYNNSCEIVFDSAFEIQGFRIIKEIQKGEKTQQAKIKSAREMMEVLHEYLKDSDTTKKIEIAGLDLVYAVVHTGDEAGKRVYQLCPCWRVNFLQEKSVSYTDWYFNAVTGEYVAE